MLATDKISQAFLAIVEESQKALEKDIPKKVEKRLKTIISIAKHQSDIRNAKGGRCPSHGKKCC